MGLYLGAARKLSWWNEPPERNASAEPNIQHGIEAVRLPDSPLARHRVAGFPL